jgi:PAS domain S-box-containing protein/putative nucleotidyltransferase with HDIG domain
MDKKENKKARSTVKKIKKQVTVAKQFSAPQLLSLLDSAMDAVVCVNANQEIILFNRSAEEMFGYPVSAVLGKNLDMLIPERFRARHREHIRHFAKSGTTLRHMGSLGEIVGLRADGSEFPIEASISQSKEFGDGCFVVIMRDVTQRKVMEATNRLLYETSERHLSQTAALRKIDTAITNSLDLKFTLDVVLSQAIQHLGVDAADILLYNQDSKALTHFISQGFKTRGIEKAFVPLGKSHAGRAVLERRRVNIPNLNQDLSAFAEATDFADESFVDFHTVPLVAKGKVLGVLETFRRSSFTPDDEWVHFLETLAGQAAIAIENIKLFEDLQRANDGLVVGYEAAIEGWSRALDLRDKETEGHSQRVTDLTLRLSRAFGIPEAGIARVRHGALLHDIGKMGVPDSILLKPAKLSDEEWKVMKQHPDFAVQMLSPIEYLAEVIDIPFSHHEKWDGSGYPRGLSGTQIPLAARIFAIADVFDALTSDRPYRDAWSVEKALDYIREQSGKHFDPDVVNAFLDMEHR